MSHSVPSESSLLEPLFLIGTDLVEFDRRDLPIYATPRTLWAQAGLETMRDGAALDRLFGEDGEVHLASLAIDEEAHARVEAVPAIEDPLVALPGLADGLVLPACEHQAGLAATPHDLHASGFNALFDFSASHGLPAPDAWSWEMGRPDWAYDHHL